MCQMLKTIKQCFWMMNSLLCRSFAKTVKLENILWSSEFTKIDKCKFWIEYAASK